jgi:hypothetical protein
MADEQRESLAQAVVYPAKNETSQGFQKTTVTCGNADALRPGAG